MTPAGGSADHGHRSPWYLCGSHSVVGGVIPAKLIKLATWLSDKLADMFREILILREIMGGLYRRVSSENTEAKSIHRFCEYFLGTSLCQGLTFLKNTPAPLS